jgi:hypothetical protein
MTEWRIVPDSNVEVSNDGRVRRDGVEFVPYIAKRGYHTITMNDKNIKLHRLIAIAFIPNPEAKRCVDHADGDPLNNCVSNLRWATEAENSRNCKARKKVSDLPRGVYKSGKRFAAQIRYESISYHLGTYATAEEASEVYEVTAEELFGEFYRMPS